MDVDTPRRVGIYTRLSQDRTGEQTATQRQAADCVRYAEGRGWEVAKVYEDVDVSASKANVRRPNYEQMLTDMGNGQIEGCVVWKLDRLLRRPKDFEDFWVICEEAGGILASTQEGFDASTPFGLAIVRILVIFAGLESTNITVRQKSKMQELAHSGKWGGGPVPFGYQRVNGRLEVDDEQAKLGRELVARIFAGQSLAEVAREWTMRGVATTRGGEWRSQTLRNILVNPRYAGLRSYHGVSMGEADWEPLWDEATHERLCRLLNGPHRRTRPSGNERRHLLSGLVMCGKCGHPLYARTKARKNGKRRIYGCLGGSRDGCGGVSGPADEMEVMIREAIANWRSQPETMEAEKRSQDTDDVMRSLLDEISMERERLAELGAAYASGAFKSMEAFLAANRTLEDSITQKERLLSRNTSAEFASQLPHTREGMLAAWDAEGLDWQRSVITALMDRIELSPVVRRGANRWDPSRLVWTWHQWNDPR